MNKLLQNSWQITPRVKCHVGNEVISQIVKTLNSFVKRRISLAQNISTRRGDTNKTFTTSSLLILWVILTKAPANVGYFYFAQ